MSARHLWNSLSWTIYVINSVDNTKLPCYTLPPTQHHIFFRNLPPLFKNALGWILFIKHILRRFFWNECSNYYYICSRTCNRDCWQDQEKSSGFSFRKSEGISIVVQWRRKIELERCNCERHRYERTQDAVLTGLNYWYRWIILAKSLSLKK